MLKSLAIFVLYLLLFDLTKAQNAQLSGTVFGEDGQVLSFATIVLSNDVVSKNVLTNEGGNFKITSLPNGNYQLQINYLGYKPLKDSIKIINQNQIHRNYHLVTDLLNLEEVVISASRTEEKRRDAAIIVSTLSPKIFQNTQSMAISEGLNFQSGVRVETNCQNCGFTQVRLNGLEGAYSQILMNSRPVFSALNSVYGLDQIPTNIIERVEIVRGGGSALYGSNAIAGTINIITKEPTVNTWEAKQDFALVGGMSLDRITNANGSIVSEDNKKGITFFGMQRNREAFDADGDGFSELVELNNNVIGFKSFIKPTAQSKITLDMSAIKEYRRGGDRLELEPQFTDITEELNHNTLFSGATYEFWSKDNKQHVSVYLSNQFTKRESYYGGLGGGRTREDSILASKAFGTTNDFTLVGGLQYTREISKKSKLIVGYESQLSQVEDEALGYDRLIDQEVSSNAIFAQLEQEIKPNLRISLGNRFDYTQVNGNYKLQSIERNVSINTGVFNPRVNLKYDFNESIQFRTGYAKGFRAPQAFNEDLHISSVAGEQKFIILSNELEQENSNSFTASINYQKQFKQIAINYLLEGFYTEIQNPFVNVNRGRTLSNGSILEEVENGSGALVRGFNTEVGIVFSKKLNFLAGFTIQQSKFRENQILFESETNTEIDSTISFKRFIRNPNAYGSFQLTYFPTKKWQFNFSGIYTGKMLVPRVISDNGFLNITESQQFMEVNFKISYPIQLAKKMKIELSIGMQNIFDSYQSDFDRGPRRDSDYIYGPARPRTAFISLRLGDFLN